MSHPVRDEKPFVEVIILTLCTCLKIDHILKRLSFFFNDGFCLAARAPITSLLVPTKNWEIVPSLASTIGVNLNWLHRWMEKFLINSSFLSRFIRDTNLSENFVFHYENFISFFAWLRSTWWIRVTSTPGRQSSWSSQTNFLPCLSISVEPSRRGSAQNCDSWEGRWASTGMTSLAWKSSRTSWPGTLAKPCFFTNFRTDLGSSTCSCSITILSNGKTLWTIWRPDFPIFLIFWFHFQCFTFVNAAIIICSVTEMCCVPSGGKMHIFIDAFDERTSMRKNSWCPASHKFKIIRFIHYIHEKQKGPAFFFLIITKLSYQDEICKLLWNSWFSFYYSQFFHLQQQCVD